MTDNRSTYYTDTRGVTEILGSGKYQTAIALNGTSGYSETNKNRILVAAVNTLPFVPGDWVQIYDTDCPWGEIVQVQDVVSSGATPYLELTANLANSYTVAKTAKVQLLSAYTSLRTANGAGTITTVTKPNSEEVCRLINQAEQYIETQTKMAWRVKQVVEESHDFPLRVFTSRDWLDGIPIKLNYRNVRTTTCTDGSYKLDVTASPTPDKLSVYGGGTWQDWSTLYTGGRSHVWWIDPMRGFCFLRSFYKIYSRLAVRITYRYGFTTVAPDIARATALLVAAQLSESEDRIVAEPSGEGLNIVTVADKATRWRKEAELIISRYRESVNIW